MLVTKTTHEYHEYQRSSTSLNADAQLVIANLKSIAKSVIAAAGYVAFTHAPSTVISDATSDRGNPIASDATSSSLVAGVAAVIITYDGASDADHSLGGQQLKHGLSWLSK